MFFTFLGIVIGVLFTYWAHGSRLKDGVSGRLVGRFQTELDARSKERDRKLN